MTPALPARLRVLLRLLSLQSSWTYERMQGIGIGVASEPLLDLARGDGDHEREARSRSVQYFNAHPYLGGVAVGALARAELDGEPGERILRLRTALSGPLGALGDQIFWVGLVPATMAGALAAVVLGGGLVAVGLAVLVYNVVRFAVTAWGLRIGLAHGIHVAQAVTSSRLRGAIGWAGGAAAVLVGFAIPVVAEWLLRDAGYGDRTLGLALAGALAFGLAGIRRRMPAIAFTMAAAGLVLFWRWSVA
ncbi:MAG: PTS system mannose/fructose/sorbose family transporter subunit IID [Gemmatimonadales bacterium]